MARHSVSIGGVDLGSELTKDEWEAINETHNQLTEVRGLGYKKAAKLIAELGSAEKILSAGENRIASLDGYGPTTAGRIISHLEESRDGWRGEATVTVEYDPEEDKPYRVSIDGVYSRSGRSLKPTLVEVTERASKQKLLDHLKK